MATRYKHPTGTAAALSRAASSTLSDIDFVLSAADASDQLGMVQHAINDIAVAGDAIAQHLFRRRGKPPSVIGQADQSRRRAIAHRFRELDEGLARLRINPDWP